MRSFILIGINLLILFSKATNIVKLFQEFSFLGLKESNNEDFSRKNAVITVNECSIDTMNTILGKDQELKIKVLAYTCYVKNLVKAVESCKRRCRLSRRLGKCKGIEERSAAAKLEHERLKQEQTRWTSYLIFCIKCRAFTEYKLIESRGGIAKKSRITGRNSEDDPAYTTSNLFNSFVTRDVSTFEILYLTAKMSTYLSIKKEVCKGKSRALCKCAVKSIKELSDSKSILQSNVVKQDAYQRRWFTFNTNGLNSIPLSGDGIDQIRNECEDSIRIEAEVQNESDGVMNPGFSQEELERVSSL